MVTIQKAFQALEQELMVLAQKLYIPCLVQINPRAKNPISQLLAGHIGKALPI